MPSGPTVKPSSDPPRSVSRRVAVPALFALYVAIALGVAFVVDDPTAAIAENASAERVDAAADELAFERYCAACHTTTADRVGPRLAGVVGRPAASVAGYDYSPALRARRLTWDRATLIRFLKDPAGYVPGTAMALGPIDEPTIERIVSFLEDQP